MDMIKYFSTIINETPLLYKAEMDIIFLGISFWLPVKNWLRNERKGIYTTHHRFAQRPHLWQLQRLSRSLQQTRYA
jgi:hypothetical protein